MTVTVEYMRDMSQGEDKPPLKRAFGTIKHGKGTKAVNLAEMLVSMGLVGVVRHRADEDARSG